MSMPATTSGLPIEGEIRSVASSAIAIASITRPAIPSTAAIRILRSHFTNRYTSRFPHAQPTAMNVRIRTMRAFYVRALAQATRSIPVISHAPSCDC